MRIFLLLLVILMSCATSKRNDKTSSNKATTNVVLNGRQAADEIIFLVLKMSKDSIQKSNTIEVVSKSLAVGKIKDDGNKYIGSENYLTIEIFEKESLVKTMIIEHPLYKHLEYLDDNNAFAGKDIELDNAEFFIRVPKKGSSSKIKISEKVKNKIQKEITVINLN